MVQLVNPALTQIPEFLTVNGYFSKLNDVLIKALFLTWKKKE
jgi:hypothetical protein